LYFPDISAVSATFWTSVWGFAPRYEQSRNSVDRDITTVSSAFFFIRFSPSQSVFSAAYYGFANRGGLRINGDDWLISRNGKTALAGRAGPRRFLLAAGSSKLEPCIASPIQIKEEIAKVCFYIEKHILGYIIDKIRLGQGLFHLIMQQL
jgi:hypothetical protein